MHFFIVLSAVVDDGGGGGGGGGPTPCDFEGSDFLNKRILHFNLVCAFDGKKHDETNMKRGKKEEKGETIEMKNLSSTSGAQSLSGRVLDSRPKGRGFEPHRRHCVVSLSKNINPSLVLAQPRKTRPFITERLLMGRKESNKTNFLAHVFTLQFLDQTYSTIYCDSTVHPLLFSCKMLLVTL